MCGGDPVPGGHNCRRRVELVEGHLGHVAGDFGGEGAALAGVGDDHQAAGLLDALQNGLIVEGNQRAGVDDLGLHAVLLLQLVGGLQRAIQHRAHGQDGDVLAGALHIGLAEGNLIVLRRNAALMELLADVVDALGLEEHDRVGAHQSGGHQALRIVGGGREGDLQARDVGGQAGPVLRVLCAVLGADGHAQGHGHLDDVGGHGLPLRHLVEHFVTGAAQEVAVHQFDQRTAAGHGVADCAADDGGLGNRAVEQAMIRQGLGQSAIDRERAAPVAHVLAVGDEGGILVEAVDNGLEQTVAQLVHLVLGDRLAVRVDAKALLLGDGLHARNLVHGDVDVRLRIGEGFDVAVGEHHVGDGVGIGLQVHAGGDLLVNGQLEVAEVDFLDVLDDLVQLLGGGNARVDQLLAVRRDRILRLPGLDLLLGTIGRGIRRGVAAEAVGHDVDQHRALALFGDLLLAAVALDHGQRIEAVHALGVHLVGVEARAHARREVVGHGLAAGLAAHAVLVVQDGEDDRQAALHVIAPQLGQLAHAGHVQGLKHGAAAQGTVADVGDGHALLAVDPLVQRSAHGDGAGAADDGVVGIDAEGSEEGVHGSAEAAVEAGLTGEDLCHCAVEQEVDGQILHGGVVELLNDRQGLAVQEALHDVHQFLVGELLDGGQALGQDVGMGAVGAEDHVVHVQVEGFADGGGFLADGQMGRAGMVVGHAVVLAVDLDLIDHGLELAQGQHIAIDVQELLGGEVAELVLHGLLILIAGDVLKVDITGLAHLIRIYEQLLGHVHALLYVYDRIAPPERVVPGG